MTPADAADAMRQGSWIVWEPGDGTRYVLTLVRTENLEHLVCTNLGWTVPLPRSGPRAYDTWLLRWPPAAAGCWAGVRPILVALGAAAGPHEYDPLDAEREVAFEALRAAQDHYRSLG